MPREPASSYMDIYKWFILKPCFGGGMDPGYGNKWPGMDCNEIISKMGFPMGPPGGSSRQRHPGRSIPVNTSIIFKCVHHLPNNRISLLLLLCLRLIVVTNINNAWAFTMEGPLSASFAITIERRQKSMSG